LKDHHKLIKIHSFNGSVDEFADYFMKDLGLNFSFNFNADRT